jgi:hypothetical protein
MSTPKIAIFLVKQVLNTIGEITQGTMGVI